MKRVCNLTLKIQNAVSRHYRMRSLRADELPTPFICGFRLTHLLEESGTYAVRLALDGAVNCDCPQWQKSEQCKHVDALLALGLLPVALAQLLAARTNQLNNAEAQYDALLAKWHGVPEAIEDKTPPPKPRRSRRR